MSMLIDINPNMKLPEYEMVLCKLNEEPIMTIKNVVDFKYDAFFANIDEISFEVPLKRFTPQGEEVENERYHAIDGDMLILLNDKQYFYIHYAEEAVDEEGNVVKRIQAFSREYELSQKIVSGFVGASRKLYTLPVHGPEAEVDENGIPIGFLNYVENISSWRVGYIDEDLLNKYRELNFNQTNVLNAFQEVQRTFGCLFKFDTINKIINVYRIEDFESDQGLVISNKNFLKTLSKTVKHDEIKTRLYLYGHDNVSVQPLSITGKPYIENYDYYKNTNFMSEELIDALDEYEKAVKEEEGLFNQYLDDLEKDTPKWREARDQLVEDVAELKKEEVMLDTILARPFQTDSERNKALDEQREKIKACEAKVEKQEAEVERWVRRLDATEKKIAELRKRIAEKSDFGEELARELDPFIKEDIFTDTNYKSDSLEELLEEGYKVLNQVSQPAIQFDVGVVDFLSLVECQHTWNKFRLGDKVLLYHDELNFNYHVRLVSYTHTVDSHSLELKFSNTGTIDDPSLYLRDLIDEMKSTSNDVDYSRYKWDKGEKAELAISKYVDNNLDLAKQALETANGQAILLDHRGYWGTKVNPDGTESPEKLRMTNNLIAMTQDDWETIDIAISPTLGINATMLNGKIGNLATLNANQIFVADGMDESDLGQYIKDNTGQVYSQPVPPDTIGNIVDDSIKINDGALWFKEKDGVIEKIFKYDSSKEFSWEGIGDYSGPCHWEEVTDFVQFIQEHGGRTYSQPTPPDVKGTIVDESIVISDGALWMQTYDGKVKKIFRYNKEETFSWDKIGDYSGPCHWEEITDLVQFIKDNGGKTYNQETPPDVTGTAVDPEKIMADGTLWLKGKNGKVEKIYRYDSSQTYSWSGIGNYTGACHWEEVTDLALKDKDYGGAQITDDGFKAMKNGVSINRDGVIVHNGGTSGTNSVVKTIMNREGFFIEKNRKPVFSVDDKGKLVLNTDRTDVFLELTGEGILLKGGRGSIEVTKDGIKLPTATSLVIGTPGSRSYISISSSGVSFGDKGFHYDVHTGDLSIGGSGGLFYDNYDGSLSIGGRRGLLYDGRDLYIGGEKVARLEDLWYIEDELSELARIVAQNERIPAKVVFG